MCVLSIDPYMLYYLKPSYFSGTQILAILATGLVIVKFNMH